MRIIKGLITVLLLTLFVAGCGGSDDSSKETTSDLGSGEGLGAATIQLPKEDRRIAIVHSKATRDNFYDPFAYNQLFASVQNQSMMAGIPFDLLSEIELATSADLLGYDAIVLPGLSHVQTSNRAAIIQRLLDAQNSGVGIIAAGELMVTQADGTPFADYDTAMAGVLGVVPQTFHSGVSASVQVANNTHPVNSTYQPGEELTAYDQIWFASFTAIPNEQSTPITVVKTDGATYDAAQIIERPGTVVHFPNDQIMADNKQLWRVMQWLVYGDMAPVTLQVSRSDAVFIARNDMDQAMIADQLDQTEIPLLGMIEDWKRDFNFVGSYYIDVGNDPANGEFTDWGVSGPLYQNYIALGNEIGTHSWTHPHYTSQLTAAELEFEFKDSAEEIGNQLGVPVVGAAVPGNPESLFVVETLNPWLEYLSGRTGEVGSGYPSAFGYLEPQHSMMYFSLNMSPDFTLIDYLRKNPLEATAIWKKEIDELMDHAQQPLVHWLWHDYGPTTQTAAGLYTKEMFDDTIEHAANLNSEFATLKDIHSRIKTFADAGFSVGSGSTISATVASDAVGQFALKVTEGSTIKSVSNWYAYDEDQVFVAQGGGDYNITLGAVADKVTRITALPMRAKLIAVTGDGNAMNFSFEGEGEVTVVLSPGMIQNNSVSGASSFSESNGMLSLKFDQYGAHNVGITAVNPINVAPVATGGSAAADSAMETPITLIGTDADGDALSYVVQTQPVNGTLSGTAPNLIYKSTVGFTGTDTFSYLVSDGAQQSVSAQFTIDVSAFVAPNNPPQVNNQVFEMLNGQSRSFQLGGTDSDNQPLTFTVITQPQNGLLSGTGQNFTYMSNAGFTGRDTIEFVASDSIDNSNVGRIVFNVTATATTGAISNAVTSLSVDGNLSEWSTLAAFKSDPQDISGANNLIDWRQAWMAHDTASFYLAYQQAGAAQLSWGDQIYLDTDTNASTGFNGFGQEYAIGADFMIEGDSLFQYTGLTQSLWAWDYLGSVTAARNGSDVELQIDRARIGNPDNLFLLFYGNSAATDGSAIDLHPDGATDPDAAPGQRRLSYSVNSNAAGNNVVPVAVSQEITLSNESNYPITLTGFDQDGDPLSFVIDQQPQSGTLTGTAPNFVYTPGGNVVSDQIIFRVNDGTAFSTQASIVFTGQLNNQAPIADSQTLSTPFGLPMAITLSGRDPEQAALSFSIDSQPSGGTLSGTAPNLVYSPGASFSGSDVFTFTVNDGVSQSSTATVAIEVGEPLTGVVSNPVTSIVVDGDLSDWNGLQRLGTDPADIYGINEPLDWKGAWVAHSSSNLYVAYQNHETFSLSWGHSIYVDVDGDINTGFRGFSGEFPIGADYLIQTDDLQQYTGTGTDWMWTDIDTVSVTQAGATAEMSVPLAAMGNPSALRFYFFADNSPFGGNTVDHFPDAAVDASSEDRYLSYQLTP